MKRRLSFLILVTFTMLFVLSTSLCFAASANLSVSGGGTYTKGSSVSVTYTYSGDSIGSATSTINYDSSVLEYVSASNAEIGGSSGVLLATTSTGDQSAKSISVTIKFKAIGAGSTKVSVNTVDVYNQSFELLSCGSSSTTVTVTNPAPTVSSNANLSSLYVSAGSLSPSFSSGRTSYTVYVDESETVCLISAEPQDSDATIDVTGSKNLIMGTNVRKVIVTAPSGNTKTYTITIIREGSSSENNDGNTDTDKDEDKDEPEKIEEITTTIGDVVYVIEENIKSEDVPDEFLLVVGKFEGKDIPLVKDADLKYTLALLKNQETGDYKWFFYNEESGTFSKTTTLTPEEAMEFAKLSATLDVDDEEKSLLDNNSFFLFLILGGTLGLLCIVIIALQFKIVRGKKKDKTEKSNTLSEEDNLEE